jgi:hypothetical protein
MSLLQLIYLKLHQINLLVKTKYSVLITSLVLFTLISSVHLFAQPGLPSPPDQAPIDGGLSLLAAAGGAYAIKKLRDRKAGEEE